MYSFVMTGTFHLSGFLKGNTSSKGWMHKSYSRMRNVLFSRYIAKNGKLNNLRNFQYKSNMKRNKIHITVSKRMNKLTNERPRQVCKEKWSINNYAIINSLIRIEVLMRQLTMVVYLLNVVCSRNVYAYLLSPIEHNAFDDRAIWT